MSNKSIMNDLRSSQVGGLLKETGHYRPLPEDLNDPEIHTSHPHPNVKLFESFMDGTPRQSNLRMSFKRKNKRAKTDDTKSSYANSELKTRASYKESSATGGTPGDTPRESIINQEGQESLTKPVYAKGNYVVPPHRVRAIRASTKNSSRSN